MVNFDDPNQIEIKDFVLPFSGKLDPNNKWIRLSMTIPWEELSGKTLIALSIGIIILYLVISFIIFQEHRNCDEIVKK